LISYVVTSSDPFSVRECAIGTGGQCGAVTLSKAFEKFITEQFKTAPKLLQQRHINSAVKGFNSALKLNFNPYEDHCELVTQIAIPGAPDHPAVKVRAGYLGLHK
jgi:hypothetical protein